MEQLLRSGREAGTPAMARARELVGQHLRGLGYRVEVVPFTCTPASLLSLPFFGAALGWLSILMPPLLTLAVPFWAPLALWILGLVAAAFASTAIALGWTTLGQLERQDANLVATRGDAPVRRWLVAHLDTKAQGHSMAGRLVAIWIAAIAILALTALAALRLYVAISPSIAVPSSVLGLAAGFLLGRARLRGDSPGARDNGSGLLAALTAAAGQSPATGVIITSAEEFGLLGARALVAGRPELFRGCEIINLDTLDDQGDQYIVHHDAAGASLGERLAQALALDAVPLVKRQLPAGILADSVVFVRAGLIAVTVARLDWSTLRRIHTAKDNAEGLAFTTAEEIGRRLGRIDLPTAAA